MNDIDCPAEVAAELDTLALTTPSVSVRRERHQALMQAQTDAKQQRREDHRRRKEFRSCPPNVLL